MVYTSHGTFVNGTAPAIDQSFCNDIDNCLTGNLGLAKILLSTGSIARISTFSFTTSGGSPVTVNHNLGATPDYIFLQYSGNFGSPPTHPPYWYNATSTQVTGVGDGGYFVSGLAIKFNP